jgi:uncharacterized membrane protein
MALAVEGPRRVDGARTAQTRNVGKDERALSVVAGGALVLYGLKRRDFSGIASALIGGALINRGTTGHCHVYDALGVTTADGHRTPHRADTTSAAATVNARKAIKLERSVTVCLPRAEVYAVYRDFSRLPDLIERLESVEEVDPMHSHWVARAPSGRTVEWDAELVNDIPNERIAWKTIGECDVPHAGTVRFTDAPGDRGTEIKVVIDYEPPVPRLGALGAAAAHLVHAAPSDVVGEALRHFKMRLESGEVATVTGQTAGR